MSVLATRYTAAHFELVGEGRLREVARGASSAAARSRGEAGRGKIHECSCVTCLWGCLEWSGLWTAS